MEPMTFDRFERTKGVVDGVRRRREEEPMSGAQADNYYHCVLPLLEWFFLGDISRRRRF